MKYPRESKSIFAKGGLVRDLLRRGESLPELRRLIRGLRDELKPKGAVAELLFARVVTLEWRRRRACRKNTEGWPSDDEQQIERDFQRTLNLLVKMKKAQKRKKSARTARSEGAMDGTATNEEVGQK